MHAPRVHSKSGLWRTSHLNSATGSRLCVGAGEGLSAWRGQVSVQHPVRVAAAAGPSPAHSDSRGVPSTAATQPPRKLQTTSAASASAAALTPDACRHARATLASFLAAAVTLTSPWGPLDAAAAVAATAATPAAPTAAVAPATAAVAEGLAAAAAAPAATTAPGVRFTGPEVLQQLPPLPDTFPPLPELKLPKYTTATLRNGLRVFLLRDDEVPLVRATLLMRGGQYGSPPDKVGTATLTSYVQRAGGSTAHPAPGLDTRLEELAAAIELGAGQQALSADMSCLAEDVEEVMGLMAEVVRSPALPADKLSLYQAQLYNALEHQNDSPAAVARRKMTKLLYGPDSIYARTPTKAMVSSITVADLAAYVATWERPDAAVLGVVGAFEPRSMMALIEKEFGDWAPAPGQPEQPPPVPRGPAPALPPQVEAAAASRSAVAAAGTSSSSSAAAAGTPAAVATAAGASSSALSATTQVASAGGAPEAGAGAADSSAGAAATQAEQAAQAAPAPAPAPGGGRPKRPIVYLVDRPGLTQANVLLGEPGIALSDPDVFALDALGGVFNSFGGQLFDTLRSREGLAYSVSGGWDSPPDHPGLFLAGGQTSAPGEFLRSLRQLLGRAAAEPPSLKELEAAKAETLNSFAFNFASSSNQLQRILVYDLLGLPQDYLFRYFRGIEDVSRSDVLAAAAAHLHPESQAVVVVADRELAAPSLEAAGFEVVPMRLEDA